MTHEEDKNPDEVDAVDAEIVDSDLPERTDPPLTPFQKQAATFLAANGYTQGVRSPRNLIRRTAILVGYGRATIHRWLRSPAFLHLIESIQARGDAASSDGWDLLMRGAPEHGIAPNFAACIAWKKHRNPEQFDEAFIRQERKLQHEKEMFLLKCEHEKEMLKLQQQGLDKGTLPLPTFVYSVEPQGSESGFDDEPTEH